MAVISKIRRHSTLLILVIGLGLAGFLLMDALNSNSSLLRGSQNEVGVINGEEIAYRKYSQEVAEKTESFKLFSQQRTVDNETMNNLRNETWTELVRDQLFGQQYEMLGIKVSNAELENLIRGPDPHPFSRQFFTNPETGVFDPMQVTRFVQNMDRDPSGRSRQQWHYLKEMIKESELTKKYTSTVAKGLFAPKWQAEEAFMAEKKKASFDYIYIPYTSIADNKVSVNSDEVADYIEKHRKKYEQEEETRKIAYAAFPIIPSPADTQAAEEWIQSQVEPFRKAEDDSLFVRINSDENFNNDYLPKDKLKTMMADTFFKVDTGKIIGPYFEEGTYKLAKVLDRKMIPDSVHARHLLVPVNQQQGYRQAEQQIDTLKKMIEERDSSFETMARKYSADQNSARKGGDLGWIKPGKMVEPIEDAIFFRGSEGDIMKVRSRFGFHLVEILESEPVTEAVKAAIVKRKLRPSAETEDKIFDRASEFAGIANKEDDFSKALQQLDVTKRTADQVGKNDFSIPGIGGAREVVAWTYRNKKGAISNVINTPDYFVVAYLEKVREKGSIPVEEIRPEVELAIRKRKKAKRIKEEVTPAVKQATSIDKLAVQINEDIRSAYDITFSNPYIPKIGREQKVVGYVFGLGEGTLSEPIQGENGVFIVRVSSIINPQQPVNYTMYQQRMAGQYESRAQTELLDALKKLKGVKDLRYKFY